MELQQFLSIVVPAAAALFGAWLGASTTLKSVKHASGLEAKRRKTATAQSIYVEISAIMRILDGHVRTSGTGGQVALVDGGNPQRYAPIYSAVGPSIGELHVSPLKAILSFYTTLLTLQPVQKQTKLNEISITRYSAADIDRVLSVGKIALEQISFHYSDSVKELQGTSHG
jgi:hypothetical protein